MSGGSATRTEAQPPSGNAAANVVQPHPPSPGIGPGGGARVPAAEPSAAYGGKSVDQWLESLQLDESQEQHKEVRRRGEPCWGTLARRPGRLSPGCARCRSGSMEVRQYAVDALGRIGPDAAEGVAKIVESLQSPLNDEHVHRLAARALGRIGPAAKAAVEPLLATLRG